MLLPTPEGPTIAAAREQAYRHAAQMRCPAVRYRLDIGDKLIAGDFEQVTRWLETLG